MTSKEFILWLKGFTKGVHEYNVTPKQWDYLKEVLDEVKDDDVNPLKNYINPYHSRNTSDAPYSTGGDDEFIKHHNED